jgi:hypothetical protein
MIIEIPASYPVYFFTCLTLVCFSVCYAISVPAGHLEKDYFLISASFGEDPARSVAAVLLPIASVCLWFIIIAKCLSYRQYPRVQRSICRRRWSVGLGSVGAVSLIGVSAVSVMSYARAVHSFFAFLMFSTMLTASLLITIEDYYVLQKGWSLMMITHVVCFCVAVLGLLLMITGFFVQYYLGKSEYGTLSSASEIVMILAEIAYVSTFTIELGRFKLVISIPSEVAGDSRGT